MIRISAASGSAASSSAFKRRTFSRLRSPWATPCAWIVWTAWSTFCMSGRAADSRCAPMSGWLRSSQQKRSPPAQNESTMQTSKPSSACRWNRPTNSQTQVRPATWERWNVVRMSRHGSSFSSGCASTNASWLLQTHAEGIALTATCRPVCKSSCSSTRPLFRGASCRSATCRNRWGSHSCGTTACVASLSIPQAPSTLQRIRS
mmetsp:Transcript_13824/g.39577  ORF Transcript_13824/g.39577 Transcript_13824/m.39577 type:complete len:204 (-) Transcript_13824:114-725(-)